METALKKWDDSRVVDSKEATRKEPTTGRSSSNRVCFFLGGGRGFADRKVDSAEDPRDRGGEEHGGRQRRPVGLRRTAAALHRFFLDVVGVAGGGGGAVGGGGGGRRIAALLAEADVDQAVPVEGTGAAAGGRRQHQDGARRRHRRHEDVAHLGRSVADLLPIRSVAISQSILYQFSFGRTRHRPDSPFERLARRTWTSRRR